jgi:hypothetical protein
MNLTDVVMPPSNEPFFQNTDVDFDFTGDNEDPEVIKGP